jgi:23S rRNA U2552 (ribose-2'-O)-methylase RlmE/FtsJ
MTYYLIPKSNFLSHKYIDCVLSDEIPIPVISNSLSNYLYEIKEELESQEKDWDIFKKYTNPYEYIHSQIPQRKKCVSKYKPLSRSYFKMIEMVSLFDFNFGPQPIRTFHLAEGPGGFIEAIAGIRQCPQDQYVGMTILDDNNDPNIPAWKKTEHFLRQNKNVYIEKGATGTGNILALENLEYCKEKYGSSMDLITADGGFDFSLDFNQQEIIIARLLYAQIAYAILMQKRGGSFVLKIFDIFMQHSIDLIYILSTFYEKVYIIKPQTSRYANSEKYIVCKGFLFGVADPLLCATKGVRSANNGVLAEEEYSYIQKYSISKAALFSRDISKGPHSDTSTVRASDDEQYFYPILHRSFVKMMASDKFIHRFINISIPINFVTRLEEYNAIFGQQQIENIYYTISLIKNKNRQDKIDNLIKTNVQKCVSWCNKYNVPYLTFAVPFEGFGQRSIASPESAKRPDDFGHRNIASQQLNL